MITPPDVEMLWERSDPDAALHRRFGFATPVAAVDWTVEVIAGDYEIEVRSIDRLVVSPHSLMVWVTSPGKRWLVKICRLAAAHDWLACRADLVGWLADRGQPVARPLVSVGGDRQLLREARSVGIQPVLPGALLDATDPDQVRSAGRSLAALHEDLARWPGASRFEHIGPVAGGRGELWTLPEGRAGAVPPELLESFGRRIAQLPGMPDRQPVHTDFRGANLLWDGAQVSGVVDFEEARLDAAVLDLANTVCLLGTWYHDWRPMPPGTQRLVVDSYSDRRPLSDVERAWLPPLVAWRMLGLGWYPEAGRWLRERGRRATATRARGGDREP